jgi:hypothetical protein
MNGIIKKISAAVVAACMGAAMAIPLDASAYVCGDVNNDGKVTMLDSVAMSKYLTGKIELVNYDAADVTGNYVINTIDSKVLMYHLAEKEAYKTLPHRVPTE